MPTTDLLSLFNRAKAAIFEVLFTDSRPRVHLRALESQTQLNPSTLHRELKSLVQSGWLTAQADGNRVLYQANSKHPCFSEMLGIVRKLTGWIADLQYLFEETHEIHAAWIFGSYAKGEWTDSSDVDLLLVTTLSLRQTLPLLKPVARETNREFNPKLYAPDEFQAARADGNPFLERVFNGPVLPLKQPVDG